MGRKKTNTVYRYFEMDETNKTARCLINQCGKIFKSQHGANLLKHLKHVHTEQHKLTIEVNNSLPAQKTIVTESVHKQIIEECTNMVTIHGRPFSMIDDIAFQNLIKMIPHNNITINAQKIRDNVESIAAELRHAIGNALQGKMLCLKIDVASLATRCFLGINCQYFENGKIVLKNLTVKEIYERHTSEHLKDIVLMTLLRFRIDIKQIYSITTDNGANMIKMSKLINEASTYVSSNTAEASHAGPSTSEILTVLNEESDSDLNEDTESEGRDVEIVTSRLQDELRRQFYIEEDIYLEEEQNFSIGVVRCAAHTLQLALQDATNNFVTHNLLLDCREVVRRLRTPHYVRIIRDQGKLIPKLDCATRWHSSIDMVESLVSLKTICDTNERLHLTSTSWTDLEEFVKCMMPPKILTKKLQEEQLAVGDFYLEWMICKYKLAQINSDLATLITNKMNEREKVLFENDTFLNAIFLDPRVNSILSTDNQRKAKENLIKLFFRNFNLHKNDIDNVNDQPVVNASENVEARAELEDFLSTSYINRQSDLTVLLRRNDPRGEIINNLQQSFNLFLEEPLLKSTENVLSYWENTKIKFPFLYKLATTVLATPMTQVSVERLFSSLRFTVSNYRFSMKDNIIEDILLMRSNHIFSK